jgi:lipoprotein|nr:hypothetical protein [uncultured Campylobacter sp.]
MKKLALAAVFALVLAGCAASNSTQKAHNDAMHAHHNIEDTNVTVMHAHEGHDMKGMEHKGCAMDMKKASKAAKKDCGCEHKK